METTKIIGISGRMRSGKTTLAERLREHFDKSQIYSFADAVKREVAGAICSDAEMRKRWDEILSEDKEQLRALLQGWGNTKRLLYGEDYWLKKTFEAIDLCGYDVVIIDDVRYLNEMLAVQNRGICLRLECEGRILIERGATRDGLNHPSETELRPAQFQQSINTSFRDEYDTYIRALLQIEDSGCLE